MLIIDKVINRYLALDPEVRGKLAAFDGKVIKLEIIGPGSPDVNENEQVRKLFIFPGVNGVQIKQDYEGEADTILRGSPVALFKMGLSKDSAKLLLKGEIEITGDTRLGHQFKAVFDQMDIDWSEPLSAIVGEEVAYQAVRSGKQIARWGKETISSLSMSISEYLQEESRDVVTETELEAFNHDVDVLREDIERLQARVNALLNTPSV